MRVIYLLTFTCYGNRLPGDERGSVERRRPGRGGPITASQNLLSYGQHLQLAATTTLSIAEAHTVLDAMQNVCIHRGWGMIAAHVRANHVHVVADLNVDPSRAMGDLKAYASRALNENKRGEHRWARHGSVKLLSTHDAVNAAVRYITVNQGEPMAVFVAARS